MLEHFSECYSNLSGLILCHVLGSITPLFIPNSRIRPIMINWSVCLSYYFLYSPVPRIQLDSSTAKSQFVESLMMASFMKTSILFGYRRYLFILRDIGHISDPFCISVGWSGMRSYGKEYIIEFLIH
uniref:Uncharacterized protein n=1 Tax=Brassica oleracea TaxID=3712 RepID=A0A3P6GLZ2_BRAOL|nr:unnamed protein product [Brassica oleracea]